MSSPYRKAKARYGRWRYHREMRRPAAVHRPLHRNYHYRVRRGWQRVRHPSHTLRRWRRHHRHELHDAAPTPEEIAAKVRAELARQAPKAHRDTPPIAVHVSLRSLKKPVRRLLFRYHRWRYQRDLARPVPAPRRPSNGRLARTWRHVRHPVAYFERRREVRDAQTPAPPPPTERDLLGGPIVRRYRHFRVRLSHVRRSYTEWPIAGQIVVILVVAGMLVGAFFGVKGTLFKKKNPNVAAALAQAADAQSQIPDKKAGQKRVLVAGDYNVINLANASDNVYSTAQYEGLLTSMYGCAITNTTAIVGGKQQPYADICKNWPSIWASTSHFYVPDVSVLMTGQGEGAPQIVNGKTLEPGTPAFQQFLFGRLDVARASLGGAKVPLVLVTPLCTLNPAGGLNIEQSRVALIWTRYAAARKGVTVVNPSPLICPRGRPGKLANGKPVKDPKTGQFTKEGAAALWNFLFTAAAQATHA